MDQKGNVRNGKEYCHKIENKIRKWTKCLKKLSLNRAKKHTFGTNLAFQQRDLVLEISFHSEVVTKGSPPKCFQAYGVKFFLFAHTVTGSHNDLIRCWLSKETGVTSTTQCTLGTIQDGGQQLAKQCFSLCISRVRAKELLYQLRVRVEKTHMKWILTCKAEYVNGKLFFSSVILRTR